VTERRTAWAKDDPEFARQQIEKLVVSGEIPRWLGDELLKMRYPKKGEKNKWADNKRDSCF